MGIDLTKVKDEIKRWNRFRNDQTKYRYLKDLRAFNFEFEGKMPLDYDVHVYPGLKEDGKVSFYLISALYDKSSAEVDLSQNLIEAIPVTNLNIAYAPLPGSTAHDRILCWSDFFDTWLETAVSHDTIFEAFIIPNEDLRDLQPKIAVFFGLSPNVEENGASYNVDLILTSGPQVVYEDTVMPVPPFGKRGKTDQSNFFLLELSLR